MNGGLIWPTSVKIKMTKRKLSPVGQYPLGASPFGALDMAGNAWEWTVSPYQAYPGGKLSDPAADYPNPKVIRGGSYAGPPNRARATTRRGWPATRRDWPENTQADYAQTGFRCVKDIRQP